LNNSKRPLSFKYLYSETFEIDPLINLKKFESYFSLICSIIITIIVFSIYKTNSIVNINELMQNTLLSVSIGLLTMLGFIVGGLAIISGTINSKVANELEKQGKYNDLICILFSFNYIGLVMGILLTACIIFYFVTFINVKLIASVLLVCSFILSYVFLFCIFYAVSLLGTCINIFNINYTNSHIIQNSNRREAEVYFNSLKIDVLTLLLVENKLTQKEEFLNKLEQQIERDCQDTLKKEVMEILKEYYCYS